MQLDPFTAVLDAQGMTLQRGEVVGVTLAPSEVAAVTALIGIAKSMESMKVVPEFIVNSPFVVVFRDDHTLSLERKDQNGSVQFAWKEADVVIRALNDMVAKSIDVRRHRPTSRSSGGGITDGESFIR